MPLYNPPVSSGGGGGGLGNYQNAATGLSNVYATPPVSGANSLNAVTALRFYMLPIYWRGGAVSQIAFTISTAAASGKLCRYGIYNMKADGTPGTLIQEVTSGGAQAADTTGTIVGSISQTLAAGWYFLAFVSDGTPTMSCNNSGGIGSGITIAGSVVSVNAAVLLRTLGSLAAFGDESSNTWGASGSGGTVAPILGLK